MKNKEQHTFPFIERLLDGAKVEWKKLGEVCDFRNGFAFKSNFFKEKGLPIIRISNITGTSVDMSDVKYFDMQDYHKSGNPLDYSIEKGDVLIAMSGATTAKIGYYDKDEKAYQNQRVGKFVPQKNILNSRFLYHFLQTRTKYMYNLAGGGVQPNLSSNDIKEKILIPIPPLSVQERIVEILDKFTTLEAELEAELDCRKRQYEFYRNQLLTFEYGAVEWKTLGEVFETRNGYTPSKANGEFWNNGTIPWFRMEDIRTNGHILKDSILHITPKAIKGKGLFKADSIIMATTATIGEHALLIADSLANQRFTNFNIRKSLSDKLTSKFVYYYFFVIDEWCKQNVNVSSFPSVEIERLKKLPFPIPPLAEQERIVSILDKFDTLTTSISEGLPKEIELRRKQYEYYRERLLSFKH